MAFPFLTGFYSKDYLLEMAMVPRNATTTIASILAFVAAIFTAIYSARLIILTFLSAPNYPYTETIADPPIPLYIILVTSLGHNVFEFVILVAIRGFMVKCTLYRTGSLLILDKL